jgi:hypothetical protein
MESVVTPFTILIQRSVVHEARVDIHAEDEAEAKRLALESAGDDLVNWVQVQSETVAEAEACPR